MTERRQGESKEHWRNVWSAAGRDEPHDIWYTIDETKMSYLRPYLPKSGRCLEVGCGAARISRFLARLGHEVVGIDYESGAIEVATRRAKDEGLELTLVQADAFALPFAGESFDVVLSTGLLEHFAEPSRIVAEMTRVLKPEGLFYSDVVPRKFSLIRSLEALGLRRRHVWERRFNQGQIETLLGQCGLSKRAVFAAGIFPPRLPLMERSRTAVRLEDKAAAAVGRLTRYLDGTKAAEVLGLYYFACAVKPRGWVDESMSDARAAA